MKKLLSLLLSLMLALPLICMNLPAEATGDNRMPKTNIIRPMSRARIDELIKKSVATPAEYDEHDFNAVQNFLEQADPNGTKNGEILNAVDYDAEDPTTWHGADEGEGFFFNQEGKLEQFMLSNSNLFGYLDLNGCTALLGAYNYSGIYSINVSNCPMLTTLYSFQCAVEELICSGCDSLSDIFFGGTGARIAAFDASNLPSLKTLSYWQGYREIPLSSIAFSNCPSLSYLDLSASAVESVNLLDAPALVTFNVLMQVNEDYSPSYELQPLKQIELAGHPSLQFIALDSTSLETLDVTDCNALCSIYNMNNPKTTTIRFGNNYALYNITNSCNPEVPAGEMRSIDLKDINTTSDVLDIQLNGQSIETIDLEPVKDKLTGFWAVNCPLTSINTTGCYKLRYLRLEDTLLTELDLSDCVSLIELGTPYLEYLKVAFEDVKGSFTANEGGLISGSRAVEFDDENNIIKLPFNLSVMPESGYRFVGWYEGDNLYSSDARIMLEAVNIDLEAVFTNGAEPTPEPVEPTPEPVVPTTEPVDPTPEPTDPTPPDTGAVSLAAFGIVAMLGGALAIGLRKKHD